MSVPVALLEGIRFVRSGKTILDGVDWCIQPGEHWALLGANGAGKTTLLKILTGYEWPTSGSVTVLGNRYGACAIQEVRKRIGWVSSAVEHRIPARDTAGDVVLSGFEGSLGLYRSFDDKQHGAAAHALSAVGLGDKGGQLYGTLSQGEQQRVLIARALVGEPAVLILDEPCAGLDPVAREHLLRDLDALTARDDTPSLVLVTHHVEEVGDFITHAAIAADGQFVACGLKESTMNTDAFREAFGPSVQLTREGNRYRLTVTA